MAIKNKRNRGLLVPILAMFVLAAIASPVAAADFAGAAPVSDARLASLRGGFSIGDGDDAVWLSFNFEQIAYINGNPVSMSRLGTRAAASTTVIQNGVGNRVVHATLPTNTFGTVIQNTLDNQVISNINMINLTVTSLRAAQWLSVQNAVRGAFIH